MRSRSSSSTLVLSHAPLHNGVPPLRFDLLPFDWTRLDSARPPPPSGILAEPRFVLPFFPTLHVPCPHARTPSYASYTGPTGSPGPAQPGLDFPFPVRGSDGPGGRRREALTVRQGRAGSRSRLDPTGGSPPERERIQPGGPALVHFLRVRFRSRMRLRTALRHTAESGAGTLPVKRYYHTRLCRQRGDPPSQSQPSRYRTAPWALGVHTLVPERAASCLRN